MLLWLYRTLVRYSLHVDENVPGDRASKCGGLMKPIGVEMKRGKYIIVHECRECEKKMVNKAAENDDFEAVVKLSFSKKQTS